MIASSLPLARGHVYWGVLPSWGVPNSNVALPVSPRLRVLITDSPSIRRDFAEFGHQLAVFASVSQGSGCCCRRRFAVFHHSLAAIWLTSISLFSPRSRWDLAAIFAVICRISTSSSLFSQQFYRELGVIVAFISPNFDRQLSVSSQHSGCYC